MKLPKILKCMVLIGLLLHGSACHPKVPKKTGSQAVIASRANAPGTPKSLAIVGFNYTNKDINEFFVDESGGGNLNVSSASGGGGGSVCCADYVTGSPAPEIKVRWQHDACRYDVWEDEDGKELGSIFSIYKTAVVRVSSVSPNPHYLEVHIFPDDNVEAAITDELSTPRLVLDQNRRITSPFGTCANGIRPKVDI